MAKRSYPADYIREMSMEAFEIVITALKTKGMDDLAEGADAAFLLWQLAGDNRPVAQQTIYETLPIAINMVWEKREAGVAD